MQHRSLLWGLSERRAALLENDLETGAKQAHR
jgi:hypothetical protein